MTKNCEKQRSSRGEGIFLTRGNKMKKVLLTSTALVMTAGVAAAEMTMSASASLSYGNFGTGNYRSGYSAPVTGNFALNVATGAITKTAAAFDGSDATAAASAAVGTE